eukprot:CAMPEP_0184736214 /NCGR_PEP_ID=MMETSP0314-20130426/62288_1 /TAXON_ID=38298 /ORGANISM="Rhodella maculata, Strain CCMP 736" /LENGTH=107 /DNA_ID=CAMNT_0027203271 /DNA_START=444 /DNA_END=764 /DNA_ORIENTATION=-
MKTRRSRHVQRVLKDIVKFNQAAALLGKKGKKNKKKKNTNVDVTYIEHCSGSGAEDDASEGMHAVGKKQVLAEKYDAKIKLTLSKSTADIAAAAQRRNELMQQQLAW